VNTYSSVESSTRPLPWPPPSSLRPSSKKIPLALKSCLNSSSACCCSTVRCPRWPAQGFRSPGMVFVGADVEEASEESRRGSVFLDHRER
jgi:hypothetical protein